MNLNKNNNLFLFKNNMLNKNEILDLMQSLLIKYNSNVLSNLYTYKENVLEKDNLTEFNPVNAYNPATKKYVDDNILLSESELTSKLNNIPWQNVINKPTIPTNFSDLINDINLINKEQLNEAISNIETTDSPSISFIYNAEDESITVSNASIIYNTESESITIN